MITAKITSKGQITIPVDFRKKLDTDLVEVTMEGEKIIIKPIKKMGGILQKYAMKDKSIEEVMEKEKKVMANTFRQKHGHN